MSDGYDGSGRKGEEVWMDDALQALLEQERLLHFKQFGFGNSVEWDRLWSNKPSVRSDPGGRYQCGRPPGLPFCMQRDQCRQ